MNEIKVRKATVDDLSELYHFEQGVIAAERPFDPTLKNEHIHYYDLNEMLGATHIELVIAEADSKIIASGYARIEKSKQYLKHVNYAYLGFMYVHPAYRGKGINKMVIKALKTWIVSQNVTELRLEVYYDNLPAISAYEKIGFSKHIIEMRLNIDDI